MAISRPLLITGNAMHSSRATYPSITGASPTSQFHTASFIPKSPTSCGIDRILMCSGYCPLQLCMDLNQRTCMACPSLARALQGRDMHRSPSCMLVLPWPLQMVVPDIGVRCFVITYGGACRYFSPLAHQVMLTGCRSVQHWRCYCYTLAPVITASNLQRHSFVVEVCLNRCTYDTCQRTPVQVSRRIFLTSQLHVPQP